MSNPLPDNNLPAELLKSLQITMALMQNLLSDIKDHATSLAIIKEKVSALGDNVDTLSHIVRDGNGNSMVTRLALTEQELLNIKEEFVELKSSVLAVVKETKQRSEHNKNAAEKSVEDERKYQREKSLAKWKMWGVIIASAVALFLQLYQLIK